MTSEATQHPQKGPGRKQACGSAEFKSAHLPLLLGSSPWLWEWSLVFWVCSLRTVTNYRGSEMGRPRLGSVPPEAPAPRDSYRKNDQPKVTQPGSREACRSDSRMSRQWGLFYSTVCGHLYPSLSEDPGQAPESARTGQ